MRHRHFPDIFQIQTNHFDFRANLKPKGDHLLHL